MALPVGFRNGSESRPIGFPNRSSNRTRRHPDPFLAAPSENQRKLFLYKVVREPFGSWTSAPKIMDVRTRKGAFLQPRRWDKLFDPCVSERKGQECLQDIRTKKFRPMLLEAFPLRGVGDLSRRKRPKNYGLGGSSKPCNNPILTTFADIQGAWRHSKSHWRQIWRVTGRESGSPELLGSPRTSPEVPRTSPEVFGEVLSLWN